MPQVVYPTSNVNRTTLIQRVAGNMLLSQDSNIADFRSMIVGSFQVWWANTNSIDSEFEVFVSNYQDPASFGKYPDSRFPMDADCNALLWNINVIGFRYGFIRFYKGPLLTTGDMEVVALGKR